MLQHPNIPLAASCPGCGLPILFDRAELEADDPRLRDVMCAFCGTITSMSRLSSETYVANGASTVGERG
ncbi:MAG TPA: hypothetical protein VGH67_15180 [Solirubrobacteraceae bacterium]|jgi:hypothetical protein